MTAAFPVPELLSEFELLASENRDAGLELRDELSECRVVCGWCSAASKSGSMTPTVYES
jgi:hypothetical protein